MLKPKKPVKRVKKKIKQRIEVKGKEPKKIVLRERKAMVTFRVNKEPQKTKAVSLGFTEFPEGITISEVSLRAGLTRSITDFNFLRIDVEASDVTLANQKARKICGQNLMNEVLDFAKAIEENSSYKINDTNEASRIVQLKRKN